MSTKLATKFAAEQSTRKSLIHSAEGEPTVRAIIDAARSMPAQSQSRGAWIVSAVSGVLLWASFPPLDFGSLGWVALVPLLLLVRPVHRPRGTVAATYTCAFFTQLFLLQWLRYGHVTMYAALVALSIYMAAYYPAFVLLSRAAVHRFRVPFVLAVPAVWVGLEYFRAYFLTGFAWYYLAHTQYRWIELIQISDLVGAYGVSFVVAAASAALALALPNSLLERLKIITPDMTDLMAGSKPASNRRAWLAIAFSVTLIAASLTYGYVRRSQAHFVEGPRIALIQGNFTTQVKHDPTEANSIFGRHYVMTGDAVKHQPDVIVWPETMYRDPLMVKSPNVTDADLLRVAPQIPAFAWKSAHVPETLANLSQQAGAAMIIGIDTFATDQTSLKHFNSAAFVTPSKGVAARYDKIHRVVFGEYIPLKDSLPFLKAFVPYGAGFGIDAGQSAVAFDYKQWRLAPVICFEDTVPQLVRGSVNRLEEPSTDGKHVDCLVNVTNDGWFHGSSGLDQHLITALFRCVELRKPMVRAVNTGISAIIDGDGIVVEPDVFMDADNKGRHSMRDPKTKRWHRQLNAVLVDSVPLDNRTSVYLRWGDWFAGACGFVVLLVLLASLVPQRWLMKKA